MVGCHCVVCSSLDSRDRRLRTSAMVEIEGVGGVEGVEGVEGGVVRLIIDAGPDFRYQMLREGVDSIDAILLTHEHKDHTGGIDDVRAFNYWQNRAVSIYCEGRVAEAVRKDYSYAFADLVGYYPGVPNIELNTVDERPFKVCGVDIAPIRVQHYKLPILGYRIGGLCYITDANLVSSSSVESIKGCDVLVINALREEPHISHFNLAQALDLIAKVKPKRAILTHTSHQMGLYDSVAKELPLGVELGYDGMKIYC